MSRPAIGCGTDGVIAMSSGAHGPEGSTTRGGLGGRVLGLARLAWRVRRRRRTAAVGPVVGAVVGAVAEGLVVGVVEEVVDEDDVSATCAARSGPDDPSLDPPSSRAMPTTSRVAMPSTISRRTQ